jgi:hypothetical protein
MSRQSNGITSLEKKTLLDAASNQRACEIETNNINTCVDVFRTHREHPKPHVVECTSKKVSEPVANPLNLHAWFAPKTSH